MKSDKEKIEVMQAFVAGQPIEARALGSPVVWYNCETPNWNWLDSDYRVKPQPRRVWVNYWPGSDAISVHATKEDALRLRLDTPPVEFVEVTAAKQE